MVVVAGELFIEIGSWLPNDEFSGFPRISLEITYLWRTLLYVSFQAIL
jgi:hypothetical protein